MKKPSVQNLLNFLTAASAVCAIIVTGLLVRERFGRKSLAAIGSPPREQAVESWKKYASAGIRSGPTTARVTIVEFADFQCPFCREFAAALDTIRERYGNELLIVYRHLPLARIHPHARAAARASLCADRENRFWQFHDVLYAHQRVIGFVTWDSLAAQSGVRNAKAFEKCLNEEWQEAVIDADVAAAEELGISGTPSFLVNGTLIRGVVSAARLDSLISTAKGRG